MSRIGVQPVVIPTGVTVTVAHDTLMVKGPQGEISFPIPSGISVVTEQDKIFVRRAHDTKTVRALHGLVRALLMNAVLGTQKPWEKVLEVHGTGYRVAMEGKQLVLKVGYSHPVRFDTPDNVSIEVKGNKIYVRGVDRQYVGEVAASIRRAKTPDKYKGKGLRYQGEILRLKPGKKAGA